MLVAAFALLGSVAGWAVCRFLFVPTRLGCDLEKTFEGRSAYRESATSRWSSAQHSRETESLSKNKDNDGRERV